MFLPKISQNTKKIVYLMMSGGVDSSVAAYILKNNPLYEVHGVFMKCWSKEALLEQGYGLELYACTWEDDLLDAQMVAKKLNIPFEVWDFQDEYKEYVVGYMVAEYAKGLTPNPDVMCNSVVKFGAFYDKALLLGADYVATGHYAKLAKNSLNQPIIAQAKDSFKDQSYFLWKIEAQRLPQVLFPIGEIANKTEVRRIAIERKLVTAEKKDSQGLCFVGKTSLKEMLLQKLGSKPGVIVTDSLESASQCVKITKKIKDKFEQTSQIVLGNHMNSCLYTIGQRDGLGLGGGPWFVSAIDILNNIVHVKHLSFIQDLDANECIIKGVNIFDNLNFSQTGFYQAQIRYNQEASPCSLWKIEGKIDEVLVRFDNPIRAISKGQSLVVYDQDLKMVLGGVIQA
jgi:tRNA-uridine 2-sulfurtransferase